MKSAPPILLTLLFNFLSFISSGVAQEKEKLILNIRREYQIINSDKNLKSVVLNNEDFLEQMPDGGGKLTGLYQQSQLKKIICWIGLSHGTQVKEYYFKGHQLIFVYVAFNTFPYDEKQQKLIYAAKERTFEGRYYFDAGKLIDQVTKGSNHSDDVADLAKTLTTEAVKYKTLLAGGAPTS